MRHGRVTEQDVRGAIDEETQKLDGVPRLDEARALFEQIALSDEFVEFLTIPAYEYID